VTRSLVVILVVLAAWGCASEPGPEESRASAEDMHDAVVDAMRGLSTAFGEAGVEVTSAAGSYSVCGVEPTSSVEFAAGAGTSPGSGTVAEQLDVVRTVVRDAGWQEDGTQTQVYATQGALRISANEAKAEPGTLAIEIKHDCVDADRDVVDGLVSSGSEQLIG
jgi:hypothetical protein